MVDVVGSTQLKDRSLPDWVLQIANTFNNVRSWTEPRFLKTVGDMLMFWFTDADFYSRSSPLTLFQGLVHMQSNKEEWCCAVKVAVVRCEEAYEITFMRAGEDVYGKDIDLTTRLLAVAQEGEIVMDKRFYAKLQNQYEYCGNGEEFEGFLKIQGPLTQQCKGFAEAVEFFKYAHKPN